MNKRLIISLSIICVLYFRCSKSKQPGPQNGGTSAVKIEITSGGGQTDTVGHLLANPIAIKVTQNGLPLNGYTVVIQGSGCNADSITTTFTRPTGVVDYNWYLAGDVGQRVFKNLRFKQ